MKILLLAGGSGQRLWPLSRTQFPKQFLNIGGNETLLKKTITRNLELVDPKDLIILTHIDYYHEVKKEAANIPPDNIFTEPKKKNTAGAIAYFLKTLQADPDEIVLVVPSDHIISPVEKYCTRIKEGEQLALAGNIVTFGVLPTRPETGYGYIKSQENDVLAFVEKPDLKKAEEYLMDGNYFWNSGMFAFSIRTMLEEFKVHAPEIYSYIIDQTPFDEIPSISIDYAVMEKSQKVKMVPFDLSWSDVGSWEQVYDLFEKNDKGNACFGHVETIDTKDSLIFSQKRLISTIGVENLLIVETEDALLVANKEKGQEVKNLVEKLKKAGKKEAEEHLTVNRPWGSYTVLEEGPRYKIKKIEVNPLQTLSLQYHYHRSEHWTIVKGSAKVTIDGKETIVHEGESIFVPKTAVHRVQNPGKVPLEIIEVQVGEYLGEDDIVRMEDVYGRMKEPLVK